MKLNECFEIENSEEERIDEALYAGIYSAFAAPNAFTHGAVGTKLAAMGVASPVALIPLAVAGGGLAVLYGVRKLMKGNKSENISKSLRDVVMKRDDMMADDISDRRKFDSLTREQIKLASRLERAVDREYENDKLSEEEFKAYRRVVEKAKKGQLSYIPE